MSGWAVVTGASSGIGEEFALELGRRGHDVLLTGRSAERLDAVAGRSTGTAEVVVADLATEAGVAAVEAAVASRPVELLVANAGTGGVAPLTGTDAAAITGTVAVNLTAPARLAGAVLPGMVERGRGGIVFVSSSAVEGPAPSVPVYAATKTAVESLSRSVRAEVGPLGVRVTCVRPGWIRTPFHEQHDTGGAGVEDRFWRTPSDVVVAALEALDGDEEIVQVPRPGWREKLYPWVQRVRGR